MYGHHHHSPAPAPEGAALARRIAHRLGIGELRLNEVDFDDIYVSEEVMRVMGQLSETLVHHAMGTGEENRVMAYWVEDSMELVLCANTGIDLHLVRVPENHWALKPTTVH